MVNATTLVVLGALAAAPSGQQPEGNQPQAPPEAQTQTARPAPDPRRLDVQMMEIALTRALQTGARELAQLLRVNEPSSAFVLSTGRARGFILDGYGIFFDVDVPGMKQSVVWSEQMMLLAREREEAIRALNAIRPDDPLRRLAIQNVQRVDRMIQEAQAGKVLLAPPTPLPTPMSPLPPTQLIGPTRVEATTINESVIVTSPTPAGTPARPPVVPVQEMQLRDPNELYTEAVKKALIDAMLGYSKLLKIGENEWLTVAAADGDGPQVPGQLDDTSRILISIRGSDLAAFQTGKLTREEVLKKVQVKEF